MFDKTLLDRVINACGITKTAEVFGAMCIGAGLFGFIACVAIPNKPESIGEKESD